MMAGYNSGDYLFPVSSSFTYSTGRQRHYYGEPQLELLEAEFAAQPFPSREHRHRIAEQLNVTDKSILWWFQNRRRRNRQQTKTTSRTGSHAGRSGRQHRRSPLYASSNFNQLQQGDYCTFPQWSTWHYPDPAVPAVNNAQTPEWPTNSPESSYQQEPFSSSPVNAQSFQSQCMPSSYPNNPDVSLQSFYYQTPSEFHVDQQPYSYWNNWDHSPPFYPSTTDNTCYSPPNPPNYSTCLSF